jgi:hypothetical protein
MEIEGNDIESFISMIENVGYKIHSRETKNISKSTYKLKTIDTIVYKDYKDEEMILYKSITVYNGVIWFLTWRGYKQNLNEKNIPIFIRILKSQYNNRMRSFKIKKILRDESYAKSL